MADLTEELFGSQATPGGRDLGNELFGDTKKYAPITRKDKLLKGALDPIEGGAQLLTHILPDSVVNAGNSLNNWIADKTGLVAKVPQGGVDQMISEGEKAYQGQRKAAGESGFDGWRMGGNVISPANLALAARVPLAATLPARIGAGVVGGAASALPTPVTDGNYWGEKGKQVGMGGVFGGAVPVVSGAVSRFVSPNASTNPNLNMLRAEGVTPTVGQSLGGWANRAEEKLQSLPLMGDAISFARQRPADQLRTAAVNRALEPIGAQVPPGVTGNDAVLFARRTLGNAYDNLLPRMTVVQDQPYQQAVTGLRQMVDNGAISTGARQHFNRFFQNEVDPLFQGQNAVTGETLKRLQSKITNQIQNMSASTDADQRLLGQAYRQFGEELNNLSIRSNPALADELTAINRGYANFKRVQRAAASVGADEGNFSPAQLHNAVKGADRSKDKARFAEGNALMQDLSAPGKTLLSNKVPDSGTATRAAWGLGALATGALNPAIPGGLLGGAALYTPPAQALLRGLVSSRPQGAQDVSDALRQASPFLVPGGAQFGLGLLN